MHRLALTLTLALALLAGLAGCQTLGINRGSQAVAVNAGTAAAMISAFRAEQGLGPVQVNPALNAIAADQASAMAGRDRMSHNVSGSLASRIERHGYQPLTAAENIGVGYDKLDEIITGWEGSASHRANMLRAPVTEIGIAAARANAGSQRVYWALVLAKPL